MPHIKILLQDRGTKLYFKGFGKWVKSERTACTFPSAFVALNFCVRQKLGDVEVVTHLQDKPLRRGPVLTSTMA